MTSVPFLFSVSPVQAKLRRATLTKPRPFVTVWLIVMIEVQAKGAAMSDQERDNLDTTGDEESTHTADVRDAIQRAKEVTENGVPQEDNSAGTQVEERFDESGLTRQEHLNTNTEALQHQPTTPVVQERVEMPSAAEPVIAPAALPQPGPVTITPDHPMAALYMQQPDPPQKKANRLAGLLISLLATLGFGVVYAGLLAVWLAPQFPPSTFLQEGILPYLVSLGFVIPCVAFFVAMLILVLIFNRSGWWVYAVLGVLVAAATWLAAGVGYSMSPQLSAQPEGAEHDIRRFLEFSLTIPALLSALAGREVAVWFGAWIGARGRKVKAKNLAAQEEYEQKLAELRAPQIS